MAMTVLWTGVVFVSVVCAIVFGNEGEVAAAAMEGAQAAVELGFSIAGMLCLWTGVMEVMHQSGLADKLSRLLRPILGKIFPDFLPGRLSHYFQTFCGQMHTIAPVAVSRIQHQRRN